MAPPPARLPQSPRRRGTAALGAPPRHQGLPRHGAPPRAPSRGAGRVQLRPVAARPARSDRRRRARSPVRPDRAPGRIAHARRAGGDRIALYGRSAPRLRALAPVPGVARAPRAPRALGRGRTEPRGAARARSVVLARVARPDVPRRARGPTRARRARSAHPPPPRRSGRALDPLGGGGGAGLPPARRARPGRALGLALLPSHPAAAGGSRRGAPGAAEPRAAARAVRRPGGRRAPDRACDRAPRARLRYRPARDVAVGGEREPRGGRARRARRSPMARDRRGRPVALAARGSAAPRARLPPVDGSNAGGGGGDVLPRPRALGPDRVRLPELGFRPGRRRLHPAPAPDRRRARRGRPRAPAARDRDPGRRELLGALPGGRRAVSRIALHRARAGGRHPHPPAVRAAGRSSARRPARDTPLRLVDRRRLPHLDRASGKEPRLGPGRPRPARAARGGSDAGGGPRGLGGARCRVRIGLVLVVRRRSLHARQGGVRSPVPRAPAGGLRRRGPQDPGVAQGPGGAPRAPRRGVPGPARLRSSHP